MTEPGQSSAEAARHFAETVVAAVFAPWAEDLVDRAALRPGERVLDVGCGTGAVIRVAATRVGPRGAVTGLDNDGGRLDAARALAPPDGAAITWRQGDAASMPFEPGSFDVVLCQQALHLMSDRRGALAEMFRVLTPGGRIALSVWRTMEESPGYVAFVEAVRAALGAEEAARFGRQFTLHDPADLRALLVEAGFERIDIVAETKLADFANRDDFIRYQLDGNTRRWGLSAPDQRELAADVAVRLEPLIVGGRLQFPRGAHIATARRAS